MNYAAIKERIKKHEGWRSHAYRDSLGFLTIGYGRLVDERKGAGISRKEGEMLLDNDLSSTLAELDSLVSFWRSLPEPAQTAIVDMAFNMGASNFVTGWPQTWAAIERQDWDTVAANIAGSLYAKQVGKRADRNIDLFMSAATTPAKQDTPKGLDDPALAEDAEGWFEDWSWLPWKR